MSPEDAAQPPARVRGGLPGTVGHTMYSAHSAAPLVIVCQGLICCTLNAGSSSEVGGEGLGRSLHEGCNAAASGEWLLNC